jgi:thiamine-monophosphate kinase
LAKSRAGAAGIGDDCAELATVGFEDLLLVTTDPCPTPVVFDLGDRDYWHFGWMTVLINVSDIAAMGGKPLGIVVSTVMPEGMSVGDYDRFLEGLTAAADLWMCPVIGGNIKDGREFAATGTAIGTVKDRHVMRRTGARSGDLLYTVGAMGLFWASVLASVNADRVRLSPEVQDILRNALQRPVARLKEGQAIAQLEVVTSCMDASDGVSGCLLEIARVNSLDVVVESDRMVPSRSVGEVASQLEIDHRKLMLSWGNWELVFTAPPSAGEVIQRLADVEDLPIQLIGRVTSGEGRVLLDQHGSLSPITDFSSQRFVPTSYFTHGIDSFTDWLINAPLMEGDIT